MMSLWDALRMNMMISYQELVRTFPKFPALFFAVFNKSAYFLKKATIPIDTNFSDTFINR